MIRRLTRGLHRKCDQKYEEKIRECERLRFEVKQHEAANVTLMLDLEAQNAYIHRLIAEKEETIRCLFG